MRTLLYSSPIPTTFTPAANLAAAASPENQPPTVDSDVVVILTALLCALICIIGLALVARCACFRRSAGQNDNSSYASSKSAANKGLDKKALKSLPKSIFHEQEENSGGGESAEASDKVECAICLERYGEGEEVRVLPGCGHGFHVVCVDAWLKSHSSCPSCRRLLVVGPSRCRKCGARDNGGSGDV